MGALEAERNEPAERWSRQALFGWFAENWERRCKHRSFDESFTAGYRRQLRRDVDGLVDRVGPDEAKRAIEIAFTTKWITEPIGLLTRADLYTRYLAPELDKRASGHRAGEQAEWTGPRDFESRTVSSRGG